LSGEDIFSREVGCPAERFAVEMAVQYKSFLKKVLSNRGIYSMEEMPEQ
jgi:hypothetical protein